LPPVSGAGLDPLEEEFSDAFEEVFGDDADGCEELLVAPRPARRRLPARTLACVDEAVIRAAEAFFAEPRAEPLCPPANCGDGSLEEELAAANRVLVRSEHGWVDEADFALDAVDVPEDSCEEASSQDDASDALSAVSGGEPMDPAADCGEGGSEEHAGAVEEVLGESDLGTAVELEAPRAKRFRES